MTPFNPQEVKKDKTLNASLPNTGGSNDGSIAVVKAIKKEAKGTRGECEGVPPPIGHTRDASLNPTATLIGENCAVSLPDAGDALVFTARKPKTEQDIINTPARVERKIKALFNKLAERTFESISGQVLEYVNRSAQEQDAQTMKIVIGLIIDKAVEDEVWARLYAQLSKKIWKKTDNSISLVDDSAHGLKGGELFRHCLLTGCQQAFLAGLLKQRSKDTVAKTTVDIDDNLEESFAGGWGTNTSEVAAGKVFSDEYYGKESVKRKVKGLIKLMGELYNVSMLGTTAILKVFTLLLDENDGNVDEFSVKLGCGLIVTIGVELQRREAELSRTEKLPSISERLRGIKSDPRTSFRTSCYLQATIELLEKPRGDSSTTVHAADVQEKPKVQIIRELQRVKTTRQQPNGMPPSSTVVQVEKSSRERGGSSATIAMPDTAAKALSSIPPQKIDNPQDSVEESTNIVLDIDLGSQEAAKEDEVSEPSASTLTAVSPSPPEAMPKVSLAPPPVQPLPSSSDPTMDDTMSAASYPAGALKSSLGLNPNMLIDIKRILGTSNADNAKQCGIQLIEKINDCASTKAGRVLQLILLALFENVKTIGCIYLITSRKAYPKLQDSASQTAIIVKTIWSMAESHIQLEGFVSSSGSQVRGSKLCKEMVASMLRSELTIVWEDCGITGEGPRAEINENGRVILDFAVKLFIEDQLSPKIIYECLRRLLADIISPLASDIDQLCGILEQTGGKLYKFNASALAMYLTRFKLLRRIAISNASLKRIETVIEMAENGWRAPINRNVSSRKPTGS